MREKNPQKAHNKTGDHLRLKLAKSVSGVKSRPRRTQAERSSDTQQRLIDSAIRLLYEKGYAATTTQVIVEDLGVSRGAMLHHFPSKIEMMLAVVRSAYEKDIEFYRERLGRITDPLERYFALPELGWEALSRPSGIAVLEIMMASRSDPALAEQLSPIQARIEREAQNRVHEVMHDAGLTYDRSNRDLHHLSVAALRGLSIDFMFDRCAKRALASVHLLKEILHQRHLVAGVARQPKRPQKEQSMQQVSHIPFAARGGKLILYHGWNDPAIPALSTVHYYNEVRTAVGSSRADSFVRLFMVPGMQHCASGPGATVFDQWGMPMTRVPDDTQHDIYLALEAWVEKGIAPESMTAAKYDLKANPPKLLMTRPICEYPMAARYKGSGDTNEAANFTCAATK